MDKNHLRESKVTGEVSLGSGGTRRAVIAPPQLLLRELATNIVRSWAELRWAALRPGGGRGGPLYRRHCEEQRRRSRFLRVEPRGPRGERCGGGAAAARASVNSYV